MSKYFPSPASKNKPIDDVSLTDILIEHARAINIKLNCHAIAKIESFNSQKQTCVATIAYQKEVVTRNQDGTYSAKPKNYPVLVNIPVIVLSGGTANLTFPIKKGDDCLVLFNDRDIDTWLTSATVQPPNSNRLHDMNDGIALVGLKPYTKSISDYDMDRVRLQNDKAYVGVSADKIKIANDLHTLNGLLQDLIAALTTVPLIQTTGAPGSPSPMNPAITTLLTSVSTKLGQLLE